MTTAPVVVAPAARRSRSGTWLNILLVGALAVAVGGIAFAVGRTTAPATAAAAGNGNVFRNGDFGNGTGPTGSFAPGAGGFQGGGPGFLGGGGLTVNGTVTAVDASGVTIKTANGNDVTIKTDGTTTYHTATTATASDVAVGDSVDVRVTGGGRVFAGGNGNGNGNGGNGGNQGAGNGNGNAPTRDLTASDVTVVK